MIQSTPMLAQQPDSGPATVRLDPYDLHDMARKFIEAQKACSSIMNDLHNKLWNNSAAFGGGRSVDQFNIAYGTECNVPGPADSVFAGFVTAHRVLGDIGKGLEVSAQNHRTADHASTPPGQPAPTPPQQLEPEQDIRQLDAPNIKGAPVPSWLQDQWPWPVHDKNKTDSIIGAYDSAQKSVIDLVNGLHSGLQALIKNNDSEDLWALDDFWRQVADDTNDSTFFTAFPDLIQKVGAAVNDYASKIDQYHDKFVKALKDTERTSPFMRNSWNDKIGPIDGPDAKVLGLPNNWLDCPWGDEDYFFLDLGQATTNLNNTEQALENAMSAPGPIKDAENAAHAFGDVMTKVPAPNIETAAATQLGDTLIGPDKNTGPVPGASPQPTGGIVGATTGAGVGVAGLPGMSGTKPEVGTPEVGTIGGNVTGTDGSNTGTPTGQDGSQTDIPAGANPILDQAEAQCAAQQLHQFSPTDQQSFEQLVANVKSPQEQAYLLKTLAAGHSVAEITSFDNLIHNHGDDPAWLQQHLTPTPNDDAQHPDFTYLGGSWTQGQYPASLASSTILARATADPAYALQLTTGDQPDDPSSTSQQAFLQRLHDEQQRVYGQGLSGGGGGNGSPIPAVLADNTDGSYDNAGQPTIDESIGKYNLE